MIRVNGTAKFSQAIVRITSGTGSSVLLQVACLIQSIYFVVNNNFKGNDRYVLFVAIELWLYERQGHRQFRSS